jgi:hypothetical protein
LFRDPEEPVEALSDRSVFVASYFFDAARDEFDDRDTKHRDTHRCLAQALLGGVILFAQEKGGDAERAKLGSPEAVNALLADPIWLSTLNDQVRQGYGGASADDLPNIFRCFGYHLGSEVLADQEFSLMDEALRNHQDGLVGFLENTKVRIADQDHGAYSWLRIHSGHGGGAEADHFNWAVRGVHLGFRYVPTQLHEQLRAQVHRGFLAFAKDHREFFQSVNDD